MSAVGDTSSVMGDTRAQPEQQTSEPDRSTTVAMPSNAVQVEPWRAVPKIFQRNKPSKGSCETSEQEEARLMCQEVDGISRQMYLGSNVDGSPETLPPMSPTEKLLKIPLTNHKSTTSLIQDIGKLISQYSCTGQRDVSQIECWHDGQRDFPSIDGPREDRPTFCDNITLWAVEIYLVIKFLACFDLTT